MPYQKKAGSDNPVLLVFVLDRSGSMSSPWPGQQGMAKAQFLSDSVNMVLRDVGANAVAGETIKHRCDIALIGYEGNNVGSLFGGSLSGRDIIALPDVIGNPLGQFSRKVQITDPELGPIEQTRKYDYWIEPTYGGGTPMGSALAKARQVIETWLQDPKHQNSFPPMVIHVTDGMPNPTERQMALDEAQRIKSLSTTDGNALLLTVHIPDGYGNTIKYPATESDLPPGDDSARLLFEMASTLPPDKLEDALGSGLDVKPNCRLMLMNADMVEANRLITWGSSTSGTREPGT